MISLGVADDRVLAKTASMCPWSVGTLLQLAETVIPAGFDNVPSILLVSCSTFSSSLRMHGVQFCMMSCYPTRGWRGPDPRSVDRHTTVALRRAARRGLRESLS